MVQTKRILFSACVGIATFIILVVITNPFVSNVKLTGLIVENKTLIVKPSAENTSLESTTTSSSTTLMSMTTTSTSISTTTTFSSTSTTTTSYTTTDSTTSTTTTSTTSSSTTTVELSLNHVVFSEVLYNSEINATEKWIEIYNPTSNSVYLSGLAIEDSLGSYTIPDGTIIPPQEFLIIASNETLFYDLYGFLPGISGLTLSLNNDDVLILKNGDVEIDMIAWGNYVSGWDLSADEGNSIQRFPLDVDTNTSEDWMSNAYPDPMV